jgi:hypothetical protein
MEKNEITIDSSNEYDILFTGGESARAKAESIARAYLANESES